MPIDFSAETQNLCRLGGVQGALLQKGPLVIASHLPSDSVNAEALAEQVNLMFGGYAQVERAVKQVLFAYEKGCLLMLNERGVQFTFLLGSNVDLDLVAVTATLFFAEHAGALAAVGVLPVTKPVTAAESIPKVTTTKIPVAAVLAPIVVEEETKLQNEPPWSAVQRDLEGILAKVLGGPQATNLIARVLATVGVTDTADLTVGECRSVALTILAEVPHRGRRESLIQELESQLSARAKR